jgi:hypothetical protein
LTRKESRRRNGKPDGVRVMLGISAEGIRMC